MYQALPLKKSRNKSYGYDSKHLKAIEIANNERRFKKNKDK